MADPKVAAHIAPSTLSDRPSLDKLPDDREYMLNLLSKAIKHHVLTYLSLKYSYDPSRIPE